MNIDKKIREQRRKNIESDIESIVDELSEHYKTLDWKSRFKFIEFATNHIQAASLLLYNDQGPEMSKAGHEKFMKRFAGQAGIGIS